MLVRDDRRVLDLFHETSTKKRRGYAEDEIVGRRSGVEVRLGNTASYRVKSTGDREQIMHATVARITQSTVRIGKNLNRASRTGPLGVTKNGIVLVAPSRFATANSGLVDGLVPPVAG